jgi:hypothetical protein
MRDLKKEDFVGKMTYYGPIVDAGYDARIRGKKSDQFSFAIDYGERGRFDGQTVWMSPACAIIDVMAREPDKYPYAIEWQEWFYGKLGLTTWQLHARDGVGSPDDEGDFDADDDDKPAPKADRRLRLPGF